MIKLRAFKVKEYDNRERMRREQEEKVEKDRILMQKMEQEQKKLETIQYTYTFEGEMLFIKPPKYEKLPPTSKVPEFKEVIVD